MDLAIQEIREKLFALQDLGYRDFTAKLTPTVAPETIIGVRTPDLRRLARSLKGSPQAAVFLQTLPHHWYEENNLHGFLIETLKDFDQTIAALDAFLPYVDNWATCDLMRPKIFAKHLPRLREEILRWLASAHPYTVRFGLEMLMTFFLDDAFAPEYLDWAAQVDWDEYYVNMMVAWFFATALAKQYPAALPYVQEGRLGPWVHNKTIQKAVESRRITPEQKAYLKTLRK